MARRRESEPDSMLPLKAAWLHVLLADAGGHHHGYVIRREVEQRTQGRIRLCPATLYGTLTKLTEAGLLEEADVPPAEVPDDDSRRRYYRITKLGDRVLEAEKNRLEALIEYARTQRLARETGG
jgi:DNA-binding PadR family transcriptional regulator